jgi:hypothetical protein
LKKEEKKNRKMYQFITHFQKKKKKKKKNILLWSPPIKLHDSVPTSEIFKPLPTSQKPANKQYKDVNHFSQQTNNTKMLTTF